MKPLGSLWSSQGPAGPGVYIVAELSANHNHSFDDAVALVHAAKAAGADAIKLQTYTADTITLDSDQESFRIGAGTIWAGRTLHELYCEASTPWEWHAPLKQLAHELDLEFFSSVFDEAALNFLEQLEVPAYKVASFELIDLPLIEKVAATGKPMLLSTGMATAEEIEEAVQVTRSTGVHQLMLLKCTSAYPAMPEEMNLRTIVELSRRFQVPIGLSDHTMGLVAPVAAVALGARLIEKHLTLSRARGGPDAGFSLEPAEFRAMVDAVHIAETALGGIRFGPTTRELNSVVFRRSLFVVQDVRAGDWFTDSNIRSVRPGYGLHPRYFKQVLGRQASRDITRGTPLSWDMVQQ
jgi:N-acetylneuraminate synthase